MGPVEQKEAPTEAKQTSKLSREQLRRKDRIESEAQETFHRVTENYLDFFTKHEDPEDDAVYQKQKQISAQWRLYCFRKKLTASAFPAVDEYCNKVRENYITLKNMDVLQAKVNEETKRKSDTVVVPDPMPDGKTLY